MARPSDEHSTAADQVAANQRSAAQWRQSNQQSDTRQTEGSLHGLAISPLSPAPLFRL